MIPTKEFCTTLHEGQKKVLKAFDNRTSRFFILNWARRHRKTTLAINILIKEAMTHPNSVYLYVAPTYKQAKNIIWRDPNMLTKWLPEKYIKRKVEQELFIELHNGSIIQIKGGEDISSLKGINCHGLIFDEFSVFRYPEEVWLEVFRPIIAQDVRRWAMFISTPKGMNYFFKLWNQAKERDDWFTSELRATDTNLIPEKELEKARIEMLPVLFQQEFLCSFIADEEFTLITSRMIDDLKNVNIISSVGKKIISVDPAFGGDEMVAYYFEDTQICDSLYLYTRDPDKVYSQLSIFCQKNDCKDVIIDTIGIGHGVGHQMSKMGYNVIPFNAAEKSSFEKYANKKSEAWWYTMEKINRIECWYPKEIELIRQLSSVRYLPEGRNGAFCLEKKSDTKKRTGIAQDRADAYVMGIYGLQFVQNELDKRKFYTAKKDLPKPLKSRYGW